MAHEPARPTSLTFGDLGGAVRVVVPTDAIAVSLRQMLAGLHLTGADAVRASLRLEGGTEAWTVTGDESPRHTFPTLPAALEALEYLVTVRLLCLAGDRPHLHAAGVVHRDRAILALGASGTGKTTLALRWSAMRRAVLSDDVVLLQRDGRLAGFRRLFTTTRAGLERAGLPAAATASDDPDLARFDPAPYGGWADAAPAAVLAWTGYQPGVETDIRHLSKPEALNRLTAALLPTGLPAARCFENLVELVRTTVTLELVFGDVRRAAGALLDLA
jgi:hypothetical protein